MKKTLITLVSLAAASVASAAPALTLTSTELSSLGGTYTDTGNKIQTSGYGNYTLTLVLDAQKFLAAVQASPFAETQIITPDASNDIGLYIKSDNTYGTGLYGTWNTGSTLYAFWKESAGQNGAPTSHLTEYLANNSGTTYTDIAVSYEASGNGSVTYLTLVDSAGVATTLYGINSGLKGNTTGDITGFTYNTELVKHIDVYTEVLNAEAAAAANLSAIAANASVIPGGIVPEPTTATLSLLAFAGLAARRRRK